MGLKATRAKKRSALAFPAPMDTTPPPPAQPVVPVPQDEFAALASVSARRTQPPPDFVHLLGILKGDAVKREADIVPIKRTEQALIPHHDELPPPP